MNELKPPKYYEASDVINARSKHRTVFVAGSIEMGKAENWQTKLVEALKDYDVTFFNPRRDDWDPTWEQSVNNEKFVEQVEWELYHLDMADYIVMYLDPNTMSPISLLEFGMYAKSAGGKMVVCCPDGFWRKGNVEVVCNYYSVLMYHNIDDMIKMLKENLPL